MSNQELERYVKKESFLIVLDSRNADDYCNGTAHSDIMFDIKYPIQLPKDCIYMTWVVNTFTCPVSFYQINSTNDELLIMVNGNGNSYKFRHGNYNAQTFIKEFLNTMPAGYTLTYDSVTNKFTMGFTTTFIITPCSIMPVMGMLEDLKNGVCYYNDATTLKLVMPYQCNFAGLNSFNIKCDIRTDNLDSFDNCSTSSIIASVPVNANQDGVIFYEKRNDFEFEVKENIVDMLHITIEDDRANKIDFNNQHWNLVIQVNYIREIVKDLKTTFYDIVNFGYNNIT